MWFQEAPRNDPLAVSHCHVTEPDSPQSSEEPEQPSPVSVLEPPFEEVSGSECFESVSAGLQGSFKYSITYCSFTLYLASFIILPNIRADNGLGWLSSFCLIGLNFLPVLDSFPKVVGLVKISNLFSIEARPWLLIQSPLDKPSLALLVCLSPLNSCQFFFFFPFLLATLGARTHTHTHAHVPYQLSQSPRQLFSVCCHHALSMPDKCISLSFLFPLVSGSYF